MARNSKRQVMNRSALSHSGCGSARPPVGAHLFACRLPGESILKSGFLGVKKLLKSICTLTKLLLAARHRVDLLVVFCLETPTQLAELRQGAAPQRLNFPDGGVQQLEQVFGLARARHFCHIRQVRFALRRPLKQFGVARSSKKGTN